MVIGLFTSCVTQPAKYKYVTYVPDSVTRFEVISAQVHHLDIPNDNKIEVLSLTNSGLDRIPSSVKRCKHLKRLNLEAFTFSKAYRTLVPFVAVLQQHSKQQKEDHKHDRIVINDDGKLTQHLVELPSFEQIVDFVSPNAAKVMMMILGQDCSCSRWSSTYLTCL